MNNEIIITLFDEEKEVVTKKVSSIGQFEKEISKRLNREVTISILLNECDVYVNYEIP